MWVFDKKILSLLITIFQKYFGSNVLTIIFAVRFKKKGTVLKKITLKFANLFFKKAKKNLGGNIKVLTFALPNKKGG